MAFHDPLPLLPAVERRIASSPRLCATARLLGAVPHERIETVFNSADLFVLGSHFEGAGFALIEALACGVVPAVTDIPALRAVTGNGAVGALWPPGDDAACAAAIVAAAAPPLEAKRDAAREYFERRLSFPALAQSALAGYRSLSVLPGSTRIPVQAEIIGAHDHRADRITGMVVGSPVELSTTDA
jgi:glycosyltransferase involved in cell wall biosynthesis